MSINSETFEGLDDWLAVDAITSDLQTVLEISEASDHDKGSKFSAPLRSRHVAAYLNLDAGLSETTETLSFAQPKSDCCANFKFPLPPNAAVRRFVAKVGGRTIKTVVKEKAVADKEYNEAVSQGHTAVRMSQQSKQNIFQVSLGNLAAGEEAEITIDYIRLLQQTGDVVEYAHTATWVPPYFSWHDGYFQNYQEISPASQPVQVDKVAYTLTYSITLQDSANLKKGSAHSCTHATLETSSGQEGLQYIVRENVCDPSKDFQLAVELTGNKDSQILMQSGPPAAGSDEKLDTTLASFNPAVKRETRSKAKRQVMLVIDGSGSMQGPPIEKARESAELLIRDLPNDEGIVFNIMMFGSSYKYMWQDYKPYNQQTESSAINWLNQCCNAGYGGTEMLKAVQSVYSKPLKYGFSRSVVLLTDGGVGWGQDKQLTDLVTPKNWDTHMTHVFALGIGHGVHRPLLDGVAAKSHGVAHYVMESSEIAKKMGRLSGAALATDCIFEPRLKCRGCMLDLIPTKLPNVIYPGHPLVILATVTKAEQGASLEMVGKDSKGNELSYSLALPTSATCQGTSFKTLHAMSKISELTSGSSSLHIKRDGERQTQQPTYDTVKAEVVRLAIAEGLVTQHTSYIGVELRFDPLDPSKVINHEIPIEAPSCRSTSKVFFDRGERHFHQKKMRRMTKVSIPQGTAQFRTPMPGAAPHGGYGNSYVQGGYGGGSFGARSAAPGFGFGGAVSGFGGGTVKKGFGGSVAQGAQPSSRALHFPQSPEPIAMACPPPSFPFIGAVSRAPAHGGSLFGTAPGSGYGASGGASSMMFGSACPTGSSGSDEGCAEPEDIYLTDPAEDSGDELMLDQNAPVSQPPALQKQPEGPEMVQALSKLRNTEGYWAPSKALYDLVFSKRTDISDKEMVFKMAAGGQDLNNFATFLALAFLDKHAQKEKAVWLGMRKKAVTFLQARVNNKEKSIDRHIVDGRIHV